LTGLCIDLVQFPATAYNPDAIFRHLFSLSGELYPQATRTKKHPDRCGRQE
jgi:hypothetical protein